MITIAIIEDHQLFVDALESIFQIDAECTFVGSAGTIADGLELVWRTRPDVLLVDIGLPDGDGLSLIPAAKETSPDTQVLVLTCASDEKTLLRAVDLGASGYVAKSSPLCDLLSAIRQAAQGEIVFPSSLLVGILKRLNRRNEGSSRSDEFWEKLTPREQEILERMAKGASATDIAEELNIAPLTVRTHIRNLIAKLGVHSRLEAVTFALRHGLIETPL